MFHGALLDDYCLFKGGSYQAKHDWLLIEETPAGGGATSTRNVHMCV